MTCAKFESVIGYHCSPVLMGMKPANLVSFSKEKMPELPEIISDYKESLEREGIRMEIICGCRKHYLLLVYRPDMLQEYLKQEEARNLLLQDGYNIDGSLDEMIVRLKECGYWKVYDDVEQARRIFDSYDKCREFTAAQIRAGYSILQVVGMKHLCTSQMCV